LLSLLLEYDGKEEGGEGVMEMLKEGFGSLVAGWRVLIHDDPSSPLPSSSSSSSSEREKVHANCESGGS